jgi:signal transduction histidine kinase
MSEIDPTVTVTHVQAVVERDKSELARHIHDDLGGFLIASAMDVTILRHRFAGSDPDSASKFDRLARSLNGAIDMMRRVTEELHPTLLDNVGLFAAIRWHIKHMCHRSQISCSEHFPATEPLLSPDAAINLFRVGQEALLVAEHQAKVTRVDFTVSMENDSLSMRVSADGMPTPAEPETAGYMALGCLRHRIQSMGGTVALTYPPGEGMILLATVSVAGASTSRRSDNASGGNHDACP